MKIPRFKTEDFYARYEFTSPYLLSNSDCESITVAELLELSSRSMDALGATTLGYTESRGRPELRAAIASGSANVDADDVLVMNAPIEGIFVTMSAVLTKGDRAVVLGPCYDALKNLPEYACGNVEMWMLRATENSWELDMDKLDELLAPPTKILVVNFPHKRSGLSFQRVTFYFHRLGCARVARYPRWATRVGFSNFGRTLFTTPSEARVPRPYARCPYARCGANG